MSNPEGLPAPGPSNSGRSAARRRGESAQGCDTRPLRELIQYIVKRHHTWLRTELTQIDQLIRQSIATEGRVRSKKLVEIEGIFQKFHRETENHLKKEEVVLFPIIQELESRAESGSPPERHSFGPLRNPVQFMTEDHELADQLLARLKELTGEGGATAQGAAACKVLLDRLKAVEVDLAIHVHLEDDILFPRAICLEEGTDRGAV